MDISLQSPVVAFLDANVLYSAGLRDFLVRLSLQGVIRARWSNLIHEEWIQAVLQNFPDILRRQLERTRDLMNQHAIDKYNLVVQAPDPFIHSLLISNREGVITTAQKHRANLKKPPKTVDGYLASFSQQGLHNTVAELNKDKDRL